MSVEKIYTVGMNTLDEESIKYLENELRLDPLQRVFLMASTGLGYYIYTNEEIFENMKFNIPAELYCLLIDAFNQIEEEYVHILIDRDL